MPSEVEFQIVARADLVHEIATHLPSDTSARVEPAPAPRELQLALETAVAVVTILVGVAQIADLSVKLAGAIRTWKRGASTPAVRVIVRGERNDTVIEVAETTDAATIAEKIRATITTY
jgi:hypothetical protein